MNRDTETLFYNTYLVIDANVLTNPRVWQISKINRSNSKGVVVYTLVQDLENQHITKAEYDQYGNVTKWWADWDASAVTPVEAINNVASTDDDAGDDDTPPSPTITSKVTCSGKPQFRIGGSAKTFTATYYDENGQLVEQNPDGWSFFFDENPVPLDLLTLTIDGNKIKIKFLGDDSYIGKVMTIKAQSNSVLSSTQVEIVAL